MTKRVPTAERESYAYFVFKKGCRTPSERLNTESEADAELLRCASQAPDGTFILAREIRRTQPLRGSNNAQ